MKKDKLVKVRKKRNIMLCLEERERDKGKGKSETTDDAKRSRNIYPKFSESHRNSMP